MAKHLGGVDADEPGLADGAESDGVAIADVRDDRRVAPVRRRRVSCGGARAAAERNPDDEGGG
jgi:hypothetical protein